MKIKVSNKNNIGKYLMSLDNAPLEIQIAIDLIYLLEINRIEPGTALKALDIVKKDYENKKEILLLTNKTKKS